jgi:hypothetical protein
MTCRILYARLPQVVNASAHDPSGQIVSPAKAADNLAHVLADTRTVSVPKPAGPTSVEPLGVDVRADIELDGFREKHVMLYWSIWGQGGDSALYDKWLSRYPAYELTPTTDKDTGSVDFWIPLPKAHGQYFVRLELQLADTVLTSKDSSTFD